MVEACLLGSPYFSLRRHGYRILRIPGFSAGIFSDFECVDLFLTDLKGFSWELLKIQHPEREAMALNFRGAA